MVETGQMKGASDTLVIYRTDRYHDNGSVYTYDRTLWVETKTPTGRQTSAQKKFQEHIEQMDMEYCIVRSHEEFKQLILGR